MRLVSWLTCSTSFTLSSRENSIVRGNERVFEGSLNAESRRSGAGRDMYSAVPTTAVAAVVVMMRCRANMAAIVDDCWS